MIDKTCSRRTYGLASRQDVPRAAENRIVHGHFAGSFAACCVIIVHHAAIANEIRAIEHGSPSALQQSLLGECLARTCFEIFFKFSRSGFIGHRDVAL